jgi:integrase
MGSLYRRGKIWWLQTYQAGRAVRESTGTSDKAEARRLLKEREGQIAKGEAIPKLGKTTWDEASTDLRGYYQAYGTRNLREAGHRLAHLDRYFQAIKLADIDAAAITGYVVKRKSMGKASGTINIELATLKRALRLAHENGKLAKVPAIRMLKPNAPRSGFFEPEQFKAVSAALPADLVLVVLIGYTYGWRLRSEVLTLSRRQVDLEAGTLRLAP